MKIGLIDDREEVRKIMANAVRIAIKKLSLQANIEVIDIPPFQEIEKIHEWIVNESIDVLILDEKLNEEPEKETSAPYQGHQVGAFLSKVSPNLPMYIVTSFKDEDLINKHFKDYFAIKSRTEFEEDTLAIVNTIIKSGWNFHKENNATLSRINLLAEKVAKNEANEAEESELRGLREGIAYSESYITTDIEETKAFKRLLEEKKGIEELISRIENKLIQDK